MNIMQEYEMLLDRFNKAFNYRYEENSKADIEFKKIIIACLVAQMVKNLSAMQEAKVRSLGREYPLDKEMATHSSTVAWRIP